MTSAEMWFAEHVGVWKGECLEILTCSVNIKGDLSVFQSLNMLFFYWQLLPRWSICLLTILKYIKSELFRSVQENELPFQPAERQERNIVNNTEASKSWP